MAVAFSSLASAFAWGSIILAVVAIAAAITWGKIVTVSAEREAREMAEAEVQKWLQNEGLPLMRREVGRYLQTFVSERAISEADVSAMVAAAGSDLKEGNDGKE